MADVYEIARGIIEGVDNIARMRSEIGNAPLKQPPVYEVCRALLAQKAVVEAAVAVKIATEDVAHAVRSGDAVSYQFKNEEKAEAWAGLEKAIRAMKEQTR